MRTILFAFILLTAANVQAQRDKAEVDVLVASVVKLVQQNGAESVFTFDSYCDGNIRMFIMSDGSRCTTKGTYHQVGVFYIQNGKPTVTVVDNCGIYNALELEDSKVFDYYQQNKETLMTTGIKEYDTDVPYTEPKSRTAVYRCHREFGFYTDTSVRKATYSEYFLSNDPEHPNKNLEYNQGHPLNQLDKMIAPILKAAEAEGKLKRQ